MKKRNPLLDTWLRTRSEMKVGRAKAGELVGVSAVTVFRWETEKNPIPKTAVYAILYVKSKLKKKAAGHAGRERPIWPFAVQGGVIKVRGK